MRELLLRGLVQVLHLVLTGPCGRSVQKRPQQQRTPGVLGPWLQCCAHKQQLRPTQSLCLASQHEQQGMTTHVKGTQTQRGAIDRGHIPGLLF